MAGSTPASLSAEAPVRAPATAAEQRKARSISPALETWRRFRRHVLAVTGAIVLLILVLGVLVGPYVWPVAINDIDFAAKLQGPSLAHPLGTDDLGQDLLARMMYGGRISLAVGFAAMMVALFVGVLVGSVAGMASGWVDAALMWLTDLFLALPTLPLLLLVMYLFRDSVKKVLGVEGGAFVLIVVVIGGLRWMPVARLVRAQFLSLREKEFVEAARALGASKVRQVVQHILPNALGPVIVVGTIDVAAAIIFESTLSFLGLGFPSDVPTWGSMLRDAKDYLDIAAALGPVPGRRDLPHGARDQLHRRRAARRLRSAPRALGAIVSVADTLLDIRGLKTWFKIEDGMVRAVDGVDLHIDRGETRGRGGRIGLRQDRDRALGAEADRHAAGPLRGRPDPVAGQGPHPARPGRDEQDPRPRDRHHLPGADDLAQPGLHGGRPDRRGDRAAPEAVAQAGDGGRRRDAAAGQHPQPAAARARLSAPVLRRHAPARHDRHGALLPAQAPDRRRADHGARRHHPGADPRADAGDEGQASAWRSC